MAALAPSEADIKLMLAAKVHLGTRNVDANMERYVWKQRSNDGTAAIPSKLPIPQLF
jgi:small subunit ribosomal protein SAe